MAKLLELKGISKTFPGVKALSNVNLDLQAGEVLGLCGENGAGKSTLMKILTGIYTADPGGEILFEGKPIKVAGPRQAQEMGLSIIHQELNLIPDLTVAQNIFIGRKDLNRGGFIKDKEQFRRAGELLEKLNIPIDPKTYARDLSVARQQMVEIAKALSFDSRVLVMDEPTAALTETEIATLFSLIAAFVSDRTGLIYISHRMNEISEITNRVSVLRDGEYVGTVETAQTPVREIISLMVGREIVAEARPRNGENFGEEVLRVENLSTRKLLKNISFTLHRGEILGIAGLMGAGRTEVARCIVGADPSTGGSIEVFGKKVRIRRPADAVRAGIGYLSEDRKSFGLLLDQDVKANIAISSLDRFHAIGFIREASIREVGAKYVKKLKIKTPSINQLLRNLSGGNQQKVIIAKWLVRDSEILIFDEPTRGIDVGAKEEIYELLEVLAAQGKSIIMISSELPEVLRMSHRIAVMSHGTLAGILKNSEASQEKIMELATAVADDENGALR